jgi:hypothetical protein
MEPEFYFTQYLTSFAYNLPTIALGIIALVVAVSRKREIGAAAVWVIVVGVILIATGVISPLSQIAQIHLQIRGDHEIASAFTMVASTFWLILGAIKLVFLIVAFCSGRARANPANRRA